MDGATEQYPTVQGTHAITKHWQLTLPVAFLAREEVDEFESRLVFWRDGLTIHVTAFRKWFASAEKLLRGVQGERSPEARNQRCERQGGCIRYSYELTERDPEHDPPEYTCLMSNTLVNGHWLLASIYCDEPAALQMAYAIHGSVQFNR